MTSTHPTGLIEKLRKLAFPARDISDGMPMGEAVRLDQIEETIRQHFAAPETVEAVAVAIANDDGATAYKLLQRGLQAGGICYTSNARAALVAALGEKE